MQQEILIRFWWHGIHVFMVSYVIRIYGISVMNSRILTCQTSLQLWFTECYKFSLQLQFLHFQLKIHLPVHVLLLFLLSIVIVFEHLYSTTQIFRGIFWHFLSIAVYFRCFSKSLFLQKFFINVNTFLLLTDE